MRSRTNRRFRDALSKLPEQIRQQARAAYRRFAQDPNHPSIHFRQVHPTRPIYSARITGDYRALAVREGDTVVWFWVGSHAEYDQLLSRL